MENVLLIRIPQHNIALLDILTYLMIQLINSNCIIYSLVQIHLKSNRFFVSELKTIKEIWVKMLLTKYQSIKFSKSL